VNSIDKRGFPYSNIKGLPHTYTKTKKGEQGRESAFKQSRVSQGSLKRTNTQSLSSLRTEATFSEVASGLYTGCSSSFPLPPGEASPTLTLGGQGQKLQAEPIACPQSESYKDTIPYPNSSLQDKEAK
jgi:hypothetical protein